MADATIIVPLSEDALIEDAAAIVIGQVTSIQGAEDRRRATIYTHITVAIEEVLKGEIPVGDIALRQLGGSFGDQHSWVAGSPHFAIGEKVLLFLRADRDGSLRVAHLYQGKFTVSLDLASGVEYATRETPAGVHALPRVTQGASQAAAQAEAHRLQGLKDRIRRHQSHGSQHSQSVLTPGNSVDTTLGGVQEQFAFMGPARWFEPDTNNPISMKINSTGEPRAPTNGFDQVRAAIQAWSVVPGSAFHYQEGGWTDAVGFQRDGINAVSFADPLGDMDPPSHCSGTLAVGGFYYTSSQTRTLNGTTFYRITEGDLVFNDGWTGCGVYENFANFAEVATHELGHVLGLGHSSDSTATMYPMAHFDARGASLRQDDTDGLKAVYPGFPLTLTLTGNGSGNVTSAPAGIACGSTCTASFSSGTGVTLTAIPATGSTFTGWSGACVGTSPCTVTMSQARSVSATFVLLPSAAMPVSPSGAIGTATPAYTWTAVPTATWYFLWVNDATGSGKVKQWYEASSAGCAGGTGACSTTPGNVLAPGAATWWVQTWNAAGYGPWSSGLNFAVPTLGSPAAVTTLAAPTGTISTTTPAHTWTAVPTATWYFLWVNDATGSGKVKQWYEASALGCTSGTCTAISNTPLARGAATWWVQTWNSAGYGPWSGSVSFTINP